MAQGGRSIWGAVFKNFVNSLKPRSFRGKLAGKDHLGNKYFEIADPGQRRQRWFEPLEKDNFQQELPTEWESWLRNRRKVPPEESEVLANAALAAKKKLNAEVLDSDRKKQVGAVNTDLPNINSFPRHKEYEIIPGIKPKSNE